MPKVEKANGSVKHYGIIYTRCSKHSHGDPECLTLECWECNKLREIDACVRGGEACRACKEAFRYIVRQNAQYAERLVFNLYFGILYVGRLSEESNCARTKYRELEGPA